MWLCAFVIFCLKADHCPLKRDLLCCSLPEQKGDSTNPAFKPSLSLSRSCLAAVYHALPRRGAGSANAQKGELTPYCFSRAHDGCVVLFASKRQAFRSCMRSLFTSPTLINHPNHRILLKPCVVLPASWLLCQCLVPANASVSSFLDRRLSNLAPFPNRNGRLSVCALSALPYPDLLSLCPKPSVLDPRTKQSSPTVSPQRCSTEDAEPKDPVRLLRDSTSASQSQAGPRRLAFRQFFRCLESVLR